MRPEPNRKARHQLSEGQIRTIWRLAAAGCPLDRLAKAVQHSRNTVKRYLRPETPIYFCPEPGAR